MNSSILIIAIIVIFGILWFSWIIADQAMASAAMIPHNLLWRDKRWCVQLVCRVALIGLVLIPLAIVGTMLIGAPFQTITYSGLGKAQNPALENFSACSDPNGVELIFTMRSLDSAQQSASADMSLCVGDQLLKNLTVAGSEARPLSGGLTTSGISESFLQSSFRVSYQASTPQIPLTRTVTIESILNQVDPSGLRGPVDLGSINIPLIGDASSYPLDSYSAAGLWVVFPPNGMEVVYRSSTSFSWIAATDVAATPNADDISWRYGYVHTLGDVIEASRITSIKYFVLLISALPLLLFIGLLTLVRRTINDPKRHQFPAELLIGVGAFFLAIIPVRAVLVSTDISQITVTDYILGTEMTVMVASSLMIAIAGSTKPNGKVSLADKIKPYSSDAGVPIETDDRSEKASLKESKLHVLGKRGREARAKVPVDQSSVVAQTPAPIEGGHSRRREWLRRTLMLGISGVAVAAEAWKVVRSVRGRR